MVRVAHCIVSSSLTGVWCPVCHEVRAQLHVPDLMGCPIAARKIVGLGSSTAVSMPVRSVASFSPRDINCFAKLLLGAARHCI